MKVAKIKNRDKTFQIGKILCVGRNYVAHAEEMGNEVPEFPIIFLKPASNVIYSGESLEYTSHSDEVHHEVELLLLIGKGIKKGNLEEAENSIAGYGVGLDMTLRDIQSKAKAKGHPWTLAKCFDGSAVISQFVSKDDYSLTLEENIRLTLNEEVKQNSLLKNMIFSPAEIVSFISARMSIEEGDIIFTGTPAGVGKVLPGDKLKGEISGIGTVNTEIIKVN